jgi:hypothetical protein
MYENEITIEIVMKDGRAYVIGQSANEDPNYFWDRAWFMVKNIDMPHLIANSHRWVIEKFLGGSF